MSADNNNQFYEQTCNDFATFSSPLQEHNEDNGADDYHHELWAGEIASMANEGIDDRIESLKGHEVASDDEFPFIDPDCFYLPLAKPLNF